MISSNEALLGLTAVLDIISIAAFAIAAGIFAVLCYKDCHKCLPTKGKQQAIAMKLFHYTHSYLMLSLRKQAPCN